MSEPNFRNKRRVSMQLEYTVIPSIFATSEDADDLAHIMGNELIHAVYRKLAGEFDLSRLTIGMVRISTPND